MLPERTGFPYGASCWAQDWPTHNQILSTSLSFQSQCHLCEIMYQALSAFHTASNWVEVVVALIHNLEWSPLLLPCVQRGVTSQCVSINFGQLIGLESSHLGIVFTKGFHKLSLGVS